MGFSHGTPSTTKKCPTCNREFRVFASTTKRGDGKYCSKPCRPYQGPGNPNWRGGHIIDPQGRTMIYAPNHPNATLLGGTHVYRYRMIAAEMLGRPLQDNEIVHHINGNPSDDRPDNLMVMSQSEHLKIHELSRGCQK